MADQKKRGFHAFEDRVHQIEEEEAKRESSPEPQRKESGAERGSPPAGREESKPRR
jgi:hypothetical protein